MNILVIAGCCLLQNSSANLCHRSYIEGMISLGHSVDLLCYSKDNISIDTGLKLPSVREFYEYNGVSLYEKLANKAKKANTASFKNIKDDALSKMGTKSNIINKLKKLFRKSYGIYNPSIVWFRSAKKFRTDRKYDIVFSLSYPPVSHYLASYLIKKNRINCERWIQIWEDPWTCDLYNKDNKKKCYKAEKKLLKSASEIVYVAPGTLKKQQDMFPDCVEKMRWEPVPFYYTNISEKYNRGENHYGYFGDYFPEVRNITPFYNAAKKMDINVYICGSPYGLLNSENNIQIYPRLSLNELKKYEDDTNVIVCLFNLGGGQIPGKIYQYSATDKIILGILDGTDDEQEIIKEYFDQFNRIIFCKNTEESICQAINKIEKGNFGGVKNEPINDFSSENIIKKLIG